MQSGHRVIEYDGNWQGFQAAMAHYDDRHLTVIVLTNLALCRAQRIAHSVAALFDPALARFDVPTRDLNPQLTRGFKGLIADSARGAPISVPLTPLGRKRLTPTWIAALGRELRAAGPIAAVTLASEEGAHGMLERVYRVDAKEMVDFFSVRYNAADGAVDDASVYQEY